MNLNKGNDPNAAFQQYSIAYINIIKPAGVLVGVRQYKPKKNLSQPWCVCGGGALGPTPMLWLGKQFSQKRVFSCY